MKVVQEALVELSALLSFSSISNRMSKAISMSYEWMVASCLTVLSEAQVYKVCF